MKQITISMDAQSAEYMMRIVDRWFRHFYTVHGVRRLNSGKNFIQFEISASAWEYIERGAQWEFVHRTGKSICYHKGEITLVGAD